MGGPREKHTKKEPRGERRQYKQEDIDAAIKSISQKQQEFEKVKKLVSVSECGMQDHDIKQDHKSENPLSKELHQWLQATESDLQEAENLKTAIEKAVALKPKEIEKKDEYTYALDIVDAVDQKAIKATHTAKNAEDVFKATKIFITNRDLLIELAKKVYENMPKKVGDDLSKFLSAIYYLNTTAAFAISGGNQKKWSPDMQQILLSIIYYDPVIKELRPNNKAIFDYLKNIRDLCDNIRSDSFNPDIQAKVPKALFAIQEAFTAVLKSNDSDKVYTHIAGICSDKSEGITAFITCGMENNMEKDIKESDAISSDKEHNVSKTASSALILAKFNKNTTSLETQLDECLSKLYDTSHDKDILKKIYNIPPTRGEKSVYESVAQQTISTYMKDEKTIAFITIEELFQFLKHAIFLYFHNKNSEEGTSKYMVKLLETIWDIEGFVPPKDFHMLNNKAPGEDSKKSAEPPSRSQTPASVTSSTSSTNRSRSFTPVESSSISVTPTVIPDSPESVKKPPTKTFER